MSKNKIIFEIKKNFNISAIYANRVFSLASDIDKNNIIKVASKIISEKPKPFIKWVGGKRQLLGQFKIMNLYPPERFDSNKATYFEPFIGGGAVFFDLLPKNAVLSDLNKELVITYNVIKNNVEDLIKSLEKHKNDKEYFLEIRSQNADDLSDLNIASRFIYLNKTCFNGLYRVNKKGQFNVPFGKYVNPLICDKENLIKVSKELQRVEILNQDYKGVLKSATEGDFIYFDPPYYPINRTSSFTSYTSKEFLKKEQIELRDVFVELAKRGCFVMLSNSDTPFVKGIYSDIKNKKVKINKVYAGRNVNSKASMRGKISEVLIINY